MATGLYLLTLALLSTTSANAGFHSLSYLATLSSGVPHLPEYMEVGLVDGVVFIGYDSNSSRAEPKQDWMTRVTANVSKYLEIETVRCENDHRTSKNLMREIQGRLKQTGGVHTLQVRKGCEPGKAGGYYQVAYDGEDFLSFNLETQTWIAETPEAQSTKMQLDKEESHYHLQYFLTSQCPAQLKTFLDYGKSSLLRTELPSVSLLQKTPSSPIVCHATGFYPPAAMLFWTRDGEEIHKGYRTEVLPNPDGTFQMRARLKLSDLSEDWGRFSCVFQMDDVQQTKKITKLDKAAILPQRQNPETERPEDSTDLTNPLVACVVLLFTAYGLLISLHVASILKLRRKEELSWKFFCVVAGIASSFAFAGFVVLFTCCVLALVKSSKMDPLAFVFTWIVMIPSPVALFVTDRIETKMEGQMSPPASNTSEGVEMSTRRRLRIVQTASDEVLEET